MAKKTKYQMTSRNIIGYLNSLSKTYANEMINVLDIKNKTDKKLITNIMITAVFRGVNDYNRIVRGE